MSRTVFKLLGISVAGGATATAGILLGFPELTQREFAEPLPFSHPQPEVTGREANLKRLQQFSTKDKPLDMLVIGGGATGSGVAVDAATRGMKVGLVEAKDFASGTSSRSTKLLHGGVRYLEKAIFQLDRSQLNLVFEALKERSIAIHAAPHLCAPLPTLLPCYGSYELPWYLLGMKAYDLVAAAGTGTLQGSQRLGAKAAAERFPNVAKKRDGEELSGGVLYYDGQMDDARLNVSTAMTAAKFGAHVANYCRVISIQTEVSQGFTVHDSECTPPTAVKVRDETSKKEFTIYTRSVVNATGPLSDSINKMVNPQWTAPRVQGSLGVHVTLPAKYAGKDTALLIPKTKDGRVVFVLPWKGAAIAGTTDTPLKDIPEDPRPSKKDAAFILDSIESYLDVKIPDSDVLSVWAGVRPLPTPGGAAIEAGLDHAWLRIGAKFDAKFNQHEELPVNENAGKSSLSTDVPHQDHHTPGRKVGQASGVATQSVVREHVVNADPSNNFVIVTGGKWTTYRKMAEEVVDAAIESLPTLKSFTGVKGVTDSVVYVGGHGLYPARKQDGAVAQLMKDANLMQQALQAPDAEGKENAKKLLAEAAQPKPSAKPLPLAEDVAARRVALETRIRSLGHAEDDKVVNHLFHTYGTEAVTLLSEFCDLNKTKKAKVESNLRRLHPEYPITEAEVRYTAKFEQAVRPTDFLCRRTRMSFLDIAAAEAMLPRVVDIMAEELRWSGSEKKNQMANAKDYLKIFRVQ